MERPKSIIVVWQHKTKITYKHYSNLMDFEDADKIGKQNNYGKTLFISYPQPLKKRLLKSIKDLKNGIKYHYPICCILNFCTDTILNRPSHPLRYTESTNYVVCTIHHKKYGKKPIPEGYY